VPHEDELLKTELTENINVQHILDGWQGILYHFVIDGKGNICTGRPVEDVSPRYDKEAIVIAESGSHSATESSRLFCERICEEYKLKRKEIAIHVQDA